MFILEDQNNIAAHFIAELRDQHIQQDRMRFRQNLRRLGQVLAYHVSTSLDYVSESVQTPLGLAATRKISNYPILITILRAGLPFHEGFLDYFDRADCGFIGASRSQQDQNHRFHIEAGYSAAPSLEGKTVVIVDPMLATGKSLSEALHILSRYGKAKQIHMVAAVASRAAVNYIAEHHAEVRLWIGALDEHLDEHSYIVPGLGDAGDLCFGEKIRPV